MAILIPKYGLTNDKAMTIVEDLITNHNLHYLSINTIKEIDSVDEIVVTLRLFVVKGEEV